jgi:hypothetical protein
MKKFTQFTIRKLTRWKTLGSIPDRARDFSLRQIPRPALGPSTLFSKYQEFLHWGVNMQGCEADNSPTSKGRTKTEWSYTSTPPSTFMIWTGASLLL